MAPAPAPAPAPTPAMAPAAGAPAVGLAEESPRDQKNKAVLESEDVSMADLRDGDLPVPGSEPSDGPEKVPEPMEGKGGDTTECSSSFGGTFSGFSDEGELDVESEVNSLTMPPTDEGSSSMLPSRKKVTAEWRNSVRPTMWRMQWVELQMKQLSSQIARYDRELALIEKEKEQQQGVSTTNGSMPDAMLTGKDHRNRSMERRKRNRHEDIADTSLYIKKHPILSHYNDKQNKGVETDAVLLDDDSSRSGDIAALLAEDYDMISEQVSLREILSTIDMTKSRVNLLQDRLKKAHLQEDNLAFSEDNTQVRVPRKRQRTQKFSDTSYMTHQNTKSQKYRNAKPQKRKNLNILSKDNDGLALAVKPGFPEGDTNSQIEDSEGNSGGKSGERNRSEDRAIGMALLLGVDNSLPNGHMGDLCENADDILIDNQTANEGSPQFEKIEHLPSEISSKEQNPSSLVEVQKTSPLKVDGISSPLKVDSTSAIVLNREPLLEKSSMLKPVKKRDWRPRERNSVWGSSSSAIHCKIGAFIGSDLEQKSKDALPSAKVETESTPTSPMDPDIMTPLSALKKRKSAAAEENEAGNLSSKKQKTGTSAGNKSAAAAECNSATIKEEAENSSPEANTQGTECTRSRVIVEKAVLVAVNNRRSQRVRKPKLY